MGLFKIAAVPLGLGMVVLLCALGTTPAAAGQYVVRPGDTETTMLALPSAEDTSATTPHTVPLVALRIGDRALALNGFWYPLTWDGAGIRCYSPGTKRSECGASRPTVAPSQPPLSSSMR